MRPKSSGAMQGLAGGFARLIQEFSGLPRLLDGGTGRTRSDLLHALRAFLCMWCASCGALAPPFPRKGLAPTSLILRLRCRLPAGDAIDCAARSLKGTLHESNSE